MYFTYMMTSISNSVIYIGVTNDLRRRVREHKEGIADGFTKRYHVHKLVYYEEYSDIYTAISREKQLKGYRRLRKLELIRMKNPNFDDLADMVLMW